MPHAKYLQSGLLRQGVQLALRAKNLQNIFLLPSSGFNSRGSRSSNEATSKSTLLSRRSTLTSNFDKVLSVLSMFTTKAKTGHRKSEDRSPQKRRL
eukprot:6698502-Karenia_brevis.AAC.1